MRSGHQLVTVRYFAIVDADEMLPRDFLSRMLPSFDVDDQIGFVQANHRYLNNKTSAFASAMSEHADLHWGLFLPARNKYGFVMFYGHGAVIRKRVWEKVGGFPEIVSEDIAFTTKIRELGFYGVFLKDVVAGEAFSPTTIKASSAVRSRWSKARCSSCSAPARSFLVF